jgi:hypothetical protein
VIGVPKRTSIAEFKKTEWLVAARYSVDNLKISEACVDLSIELRYDLRSNVRRSDDTKPVA